MNGRISTPVLWTVGICWLAAPAAQGVTLYVDAGCGDDVKVGTSSNCADADGPKRTIQAAIDAATSGDTVMVAPGIYLENINFELKAITVSSTQGADVTTIRGDQTTRVVFIGSFEGADSAVLDGFTVTNGRGGVNIIGSPVVINCRIVRNSTTFIRFAPIEGAGMRISDGSSPIISNCLFLQNSNDDRDYNGGGILVRNADANISNCTFIENSARGGGGIYIVGDSDVTVVNCDFFRNSVRLVGAGVTATGSGTTTLINCTFRENSALDRGGAMFYTSGHVDLINCAMVNNTARRGVTWNNGGTANFINCTLAGNTASQDTAGADIGVGDTFTNCILWGNTLNGVADQTAQIFGLDPPTVNHSCVQGWDGSLGGIGNIGDDPLLRDLPRSDVRLNPSSPCVDAGDNAAVVGVTTDLDGNPRRVDDPTISDSGAGKPPIVDMGAYEFGDCNNNGVFDGDDVTAGTSADCNANTIPDECETDCNANDIPDDCDITVRTSDDCNTNGIPDDCETDCNQNGVPDDCDITAGTSPDCNGSGIPDECDIAAGASLDCNVNGIPDECDIDAGTSQDCTDNGIPDECEPDCNSNNTADSCDIDAGTSQDCTDNGIPDECEPDCNSNNTADSCDIDAGTSDDCNANSVPDDCEPDCNSNNTTDSCDIDAGASLDCNGNEIPDECDIAAGTSLDCNENGTPDECESGCETETVEAIGQDQTVTLNPGGGSNDLKEEAQVVFTNQSGAASAAESRAGGATVTVTETTDPVLSDAFGLETFAATLLIDTSLSNGEFFMTVIVPFEAADLDGADPLDVGLVSYDADSVSWISAVCGNTTPPSNCPATPLDTRHVEQAPGDPEPTLGDLSARNLGEHGLYWNGAEGFAWANVDHATVFSPGFTFIAPSPLETADDGLDGDYNRVGDFKMPTSGVVGLEVAIRVKLNRMYIDSDEDPANGCPPRQGLPDLQAFEGQVRYLGAPEVFDNNALSDPKWVGAKLQCAPFYRDWSASALAAELGISQAEADTIYYYGAEVVPCSIHAVQQATQSCVDSANEDCFSNPMGVRTILWGDVWSPFGTVNFTDIGKVVDAFRSIPLFLKGAGKWRSMVRGNSPPFNMTISFTDIGRVVDAFKTIAYREEGPDVCP